MCNHTYLFYSAIGHLDSLVVKSATLSTDIFCPSFTGLHFEESPMVRVAIEPKNPGIFKCRFTNILINEVIYSTSSNETTSAWNETAKSSRSVDRMYIERIR